MQCSGSKRMGIVLFANERKKSISRDTLLCEGILSILALEFFVSVLAVVG